MCRYRYQDECQCSEEKRAIVGTWCTPELTKAIEVGNTVIDVFEVHHWYTTTLQHHHLQRRSFFKMH